jgi:hypothetical protein
VPFDVEENLPIFRQVVWRSVIRGLCVAIILHWIGYPPTVMWGSTFMPASQAPALASIRLTITAQ